LSEVDTFDCGMEETPQHILEVCRLFDEKRQRLRNSIQEMELTGPKEKWKFITEEQSNQAPSRSAKKAQQAREEKSGEPTEPQQQPYKNRSHKTTK
jgi:hypothetical protein